MLESSERERRYMEGVNIHDDICIRLCIIAKCVVGGFRGKLGKFKEDMCKFVLVYK